MAALFYIRLSELLDVKDKAAVAGDIQAYYTGLMAVFNNVFFQIKSEKNELKEIEDGLNKVRNMLKAPMAPNIRLQGQVEAMNYFNIRETLLQVDRKMMILMDRKKMIFPRIDTTMGLDKVREKYGLAKKVT